MESDSTYTRLSRHILFLFCLLWLALPITAKAHAPQSNPTADTGPNDNTDSNYVLILNTYTEYEPWSRSIIDSVMTDLSEQAPNLIPMTENLGMLTISDEQSITRIRERFDSTYTKKPKLIVYIGSAGWVLLHGATEQRWGTVPALIFSRENFIGPRTHYLDKTAIPPDQRIPLEQVVRKHEQMNVVYIPIYMEKTIELVERIFPDTQELLFLSDEGWLSAQARAEIAMVTREHFPQIKLRNLVTGRISTTQLIDSLQHCSPQTSVIFFSWTAQAAQGNTPFISTSPYKLIAKYAKRPLFVLSDIDVDTDSDVIGGYFAPREQLGKEISSMIRRSLDNEYGFIRTPENPSPVFDYMSLVRKDIDPKLLPSDTFYYWKPQSFIKQYRFQLVGFLLLGVILLLGISLLLRGYTQQRRVLEYLRNYRNLFDNMPIAYMQMEVTSDQQGGVEHLIARDVNPTFEKQMCSRERIVGIPVDQLCGPEEMEALSLFKAAAAEKKLISVPFYFRSTDTTFTTIIAPSLQKNFVDVFFVDNSELIRVQQQLRTANHKLAMALEVANITPWKWDLSDDTILCEMSKTGEQAAQSGADDNKYTVPRQEYFTKIHKEDRQRVEQAYQELIDGKVEKIREEYRIVDSAAPDALFDWVEVQAAVDSRDKEGRPLTLIGSSVVISARKAMEIELVSAKEKAEESSRLKSAFLANMSHEIRTPLNAIVGFSGILASTEAEDERREYVNIIESNNTLLLQLISDILDISKIEAGTLEFVFTDTNLDKLLDEIVQAAQMRNTSDKVTVELAEAPQQCSVQVERTRLSQLLMNLLTNALKFTQQGTIRLGCRLQPDGKFLYFYVSDTGCGIPPDKQKTVFDRFVKLNNFSQGTGLGLSICKTIVEHVGGQIGVESEEGKGSTFWFTIPYRPILHLESKTVSENFTPIPVERDKLTVLVAEDSPDNFKLFETILKKDYQIVHAWNGQEAVELFKQYNPHLVLMDINMPVMNGYEATTEIRKLSEKVPIIAVTAYAYASDEERIMQSGFDAYVPKPLNATLMRKKILELLKKRLVFI